MNLLIIGASRGLGREFVRQYVAAGETVSATARREQDLAALTQAGARALACDPTGEASLARFAHDIDASSFDLVIYNAGAYGPSKRIDTAPTQEEFDTVMHTNVLGVMRVIPLVMPRIRKGGVFAVLSSKMGSIAETTSGSGATYRASKAAVNMVMKAAARDYAEKGITCVSLHPGWVRTDMGGADAPLSPEESISGLRKTLAKLTPADNGAFVNYDGARIAF